MVWRACRGVEADRSHISEVNVVFSGRPIFCRTQQMQSSSCDVNKNIRALSSAERIRGQRDIESSATGPGQ